MIKTAWDYYFKNISSLTFGFPSLFFKYSTPLAPSLSYLAFWKYDPLPLQKRGGGGGGGARGRKYVCV